MNRTIRFVLIFVVIFNMIILNTAFAASNMQNVALGKPADAYDSGFFKDGGNYWSSYTPGLAFDGDSSNAKSRWSSVDLNLTSPQYLEVDLQEFYRIESCKIKLAANANAFTVQYLDGEFWEDIPGGDVPAGRNYDIKFIEPVITNKVRIHYPYNTQMQVIEFEVYGMPASADVISEGKIYDDIDDENLSAIVKLLSGLRIVGAMSDGNYHPEQTMSRAQFVETIVKAMGCDNSARSFDAGIGFIDVAEGSKYYGYIGTAANLGIINPQNDRFYPEEPILVQDAVCIALRALGYEELAQVKGGYPLGYQIVASDIDLVSNDVTYGEHLTRGEMANLVFNMLNCYPVTITSFANDSVSYEAADKTMLGDIYDIYCSTGIVSGIGNMGISGMSAPGDDRIIIDNVTYECDYADRNFLGQEVEYYWHKGQLRNDILFLFSDDSDSLITVKSEDILPDTDTDTVYYYNGDRTKRLNISPMADVYVDGVAKFNYTDNDLKPSDGVVTLVDGDNDGRYDVVQVRNYTYIVVRSVDSANCVINGLYNDSFNYEDITYTLRKHGKLMKFDSLESGVVLCIEKVDSDEYNVYMSNEVVEGTVTSVWEDGGYKYAVINDNEYRISGYYLDKLSGGDALNHIELNSDGKFYLNSDGDICAFEGGKTDYKYGFLIGTSQGSFEKAAFKIIDNDNNHIVFDCESEIKTNVITGKTKADAYEIAGKLKGKPQLVKYKTVGEGRLIELYTAVEVTGDESDIEQMEFISRTMTGNGGSQLYIPTGKYLSTSYVYTDDTVYYSVNLEKPSLGYSFDNINIEEVNAYSLAMPGLRPYKMILYDFNPTSDHRIKAAVIFTNWIITYSENRFKSADGALNTNAAIFLSKSQMLDSDGEKTYRIKCLQNGKEVYYQVKNAGVLDEADVVLEKGDVFFPETSNGLLSAIWLMYDFSERAYNSSTYTDPAFVTGYLNNYNFRFGWYKTIGVIKNYEDSIITLDYGEKGFPYKLPVDTRVYLWQNGDFEVGSIADMNVGDYIVLNCNGSNSADILIIRGE